MKSKNLSILKNVFFTLSMLPLFSFAQESVSVKTLCEPVNKLCVGDRVLTATIFEARYGTVVKILPKGKLGIVFDDTSRASEEDANVVHRDIDTRCAGKICRGNRVLLKVWDRYWPGQAVAISNNKIIMIYLDHGEIGYGTPKNVIRVQE